MTPEQQRIAIAKVCGFKYPCSSCFNNGYKDRWRTPDGDGCVSADDLPYYLDNLNAMHEAEKVLTNNQRREYARQLVKVTPLQYETANSNDNNDHRMAVFFVVNATAAQRSEAFLKTLGKWQPKEPNAL